jgi:hypothetical protein
LVVRAIVFSALVVLLTLVVGAAVCQRYITVPRQNLNEAHALLDAAVNRRLTDDEFDRVLALLNSETEAAQLTAIVTVDRATHRTPFRRDRAVAALEACREAARSPVVREVAATTVNGMRESEYLRDALVLGDAALNRGLTDDEFDRAVALLKSDAEATRLSAVRTLDVAVARNPARRGRTIAVLEACREAGPPAVRDAAGTATDRLKGPPPIPPNPGLRVTGAASSVSGTV